MGRENRHPFHFHPFCGLILKCSRTTRHTRFGQRGFLISPAILPPACLPRPHHKWRTPVQPLAPTTLPAARDTATPSPFCASSHSAAQWSLRRCPTTRTKTVSPNPCYFFPLPPRRQEEPAPYAPSAFCSVFLASWSPTFFQSLSSRTS